MFKINKDLYKDKDLMYQKLVLEDKTYSEAAKDLLCSYTAVRNWANKFGLSRLDRWKLLNEKHGDEICSK